MEKEKNPNAAYVANDEKTEAKKTYNARFSYLPLLLDFVLRAVSLNIYLHVFKSDWIFLLCQIIVIPVVVFIILFSRESRFTKSHTGGYEVTGSVWSVLVSLGIVILVTYSAINIYQWALFVKIISAIAIFGVYGFYIVIIYVGSPADGRSKGKTARGAAPGEQAHQNQSIADMETEPDSPETEQYKNNISIVRIEKSIHYINSRVDSYILESALFGALAFTGFLQLLVSDSINLADAGGNLSNLGEIFKCLFSFDFDGFSKSIAVFTSALNFGNAILVESLVCTMFFVSVIASRLRFSELLEDIDANIRIAGELNAKEDDILLLQMESEELAENKLLAKRVAYLNSRIEKEISLARAKLDKTIPIVEYMKLFRNLGMVTFVLMLVTSSMTISSTFALIFVVLSIVAFLYSNIDQFMRKRHLRNIPRLIGGSKPNKQKASF